MRKFYLFLFALLTVCGLAKAQVTVTPTDVSGSSGDISFTTAKNNGQNNPAYVAKDLDLRIYAKGSITITSTSGNMTSIVFNLSTQGKKRLAPITADQGVVAAQAKGDETVTWNGNASTVTFTVGEKANYGSDGDTKAGQLCFTDFVVTVGAVNPDFVAAPVIKPATGTYYSAQEVTISAVEGAKIYYTTNGSTPTSNGIEYTAPFSVTETTTVKAVAVKGQNSSDVVESVITIETLQTQTIADVIAAGAADQANTTGTVVGICKSGFLIGDGSGYIFVYTGSAPTVAVGDVVVVTGKVSAYGGCMQFSGATISKSGTAQVDYPQATVIDGQAFDALVATPAVTFVKVSGTMTSVGNYNNFTIEGATATGSILTTADAMGDIAVNDEVTVTGFFVYQSSNSKYGNIIAVNIQKTGSAETPEYNTLAAAKDAVTATGEYVQLNLTECLVTFVKGQNLYLYDGQDGLLVYGANSDIKAGDKISGTIKGQLVLYQGVTELSNPTYSVQVVSSGNVVESQTISIGDLQDAKAYESELVTIEELTPQAAAFESKKLIFMDEDESELAVHDKFSVMADAAFNTAATYNVTGFVAIYETNGESTIQLYPRTAEDIVNPAEAELETPEAAWTPASVQIKVGETVTAVFNTNSDGAVSYESSNPDVATVDNQGNITIVGPGSANITATVEATNTYKSAAAVLEIAVLSGDADGSLAHPYSVGDAMAYYNAEQASEKVWVKGYIIGSANGSMSKLVKEGGEPAVASNLVLADSNDESDTANMLPAALASNTAARTALNLKDNADLLQKQVWVYGTIEKYFGVAGVKNVTNWSLDGTTEGNPEEVLPTITPATGTYETAQEVTITVAEGSVIYYTLDGTDPTAETGTLYNAPFTVEETTTVKAIAVTGDKVSKVVTSVITISQGQEEEGYTKIADLKADATATKTTVTYNANDVLVTYVNGSSVYVTDGTDAMLLYGTNSGITAGDRISAKVQGDLYLYNGLTEIAIKSISDLTVLSSGNEVTAQEVQIADLVDKVKAYENELITIKDVKPAAEAWANRNITFVDESENSIAVRDNWRIATDLTFDPQETYNITGLVAIYVNGENTTIQIYPRSKDDIVKTSEAELQIPEAAWSVERVQVKVGDAVDAVFTTNSDGAVSYESSNPKVATVDNQGNITVVGVGAANITASVAQTAKFKGASAVLVVAVTSDADGTLANPYSIGDVQALYNPNQASEKVWVKGYIIGCANGAFTEAKLVKDGGEGTVNTNIVIANAADESEIGNMIPVALPAGKVREVLNLQDNASMIGQQIWLYGTIEKYFSVAGVKNVSDYSLDGTTTGIQGVAVEAAPAAKLIYNLAGQRVQNLNKAGIYIVNGKKVAVK